MVYQDYELVATKRVGHSRQKSGLLLKQQFNAMGGFNTLYLATFFGVSGSTFGLTSSTQLVKPMMSAPGMTSLAKGAILKAGPAGLGFFMGVGVFGDAAEMRQLIRNAATYSREMKEVQREHYY